MFINFTFVVNGYNLKNSTVSVTYTATDASLNLKPHIIQQLGVERTFLSEYAAGNKTLDDVKDEMRLHIIHASSRAQYDWNTELEARNAVMPADLVPLFGVEWSEVTEAEAAGNEEVVV